MLTSVMYPSKMAMMQIDFAENYNCISQDEIQSAYWTQAQVSLFTGAVYHSVIHPYVIASDELSHSKEMMIPLLSRMLEEIPQEIEVLHIWSGHLAIWSLHFSFFFFSFIPILGV